MIRISLILAALLAGAAVPAAAQGTIRPGQSVGGDLSDSDPTLDDGSHYDTWRFRGEAGHVYAVTMQSEDFDAYLSVGSSAESDCEDCETDDDGAGGTDARAEFRADASGTFAIRANSLGGGETGAYTLRLEDLGQGRRRDDIADMAATPIRFGQRVEGELTEDDASAADDSYYDLYSFRGRTGQTVTITLRSDDFDAYLSIGVLEDGEYQELESNDDGPEDTDSELTITLPRSGEFLVRANSLIGGETGEYTLQIDDR
jgi:hypothetical protein